MKSFEKIEELPSKEKFYSSEYVWNVDYERLSTFLQEMILLLGDVSEKVAK